MKALVGFYIPSVYENPHQVIVSLPKDTKVRSLSTKKRTIRLAERTDVVSDTIKACVLKKVKNNKGIKMLNRKLTPSDIKIISCVFSEN